MHIDLRHFLSHLGRTVAVTLAPVVLVAFLSLPSALHHHVGDPPPAESNAPLAHMT